MTDPRRLDAESARNLLRSKGLRATTSRIAVVSFMHTCDRPVTHLEVTELLEKEGFEKSTIFRALTDLTDAALLRKLELGDHVWRFERRADNVDADVTHPHLLCLDCGTVQCLDESEVQLKASKSLGTIEDVLLKGRCKDCRE